MTDESFKDWNDAARAGFSARDAADRAARSKQAADEFDANVPPERGDAGDRSDIPPQGEPRGSEDEPLSPEFSEDRLALRFADRFADKVRYVGAWGHWYFWKDTHWKHDETYRVFDMARAICREAAAEAILAKKESTAKALASAKTVAAVVILARSDRRIAATIEQWDADLWSLNTPSGVIDLRTGEQRQNRPTDYTTKIAGTSADQNCPTPYWGAFLARITGDDVELQMYLRRTIGYALTGSTREHAMFFLFGTGSNGKSTFLNIITKIMGDYARTAPIETFTISHGDRHPTEIAGLRGARLVTAIETEKGRAWAESKIKQLTGGDPVAARFMRQDFFEYLPQFKLVIAGNHKPSLQSVDEAIRRRFSLIPFIITIPDVEKDKTLPDRLEAEMPGILWWAIQGCLDWQAQELAPPGAVTAATTEYLESEDALQQWLDEYCIKGERESWAKSSELFFSYKKTVERSGELPGSQKAFSQTLQNRGFVKENRNTGKGFRGLRLKPDMVFDER